MEVVLILVQDLKDKIMVVLEDLTQLVEIGQLVEEQVILVVEIVLVLVEVEMALEVY